MKICLVDTPIVMTPLCTITLGTLKTKGAKSIPDDRPMLLVLNSRRKSVLVPPAQYEMMIEALEELEDMKAIEELKDEETVSYEEVFGEKRDA